MQSVRTGALVEPRPASESAEPATEYLTAVASNGAVQPHPEMHHIPVINGPWTYELTKRALDVVLSTVGLAATGLVSLVVVPLILKSSEGPTVFKHTRAGKGGKEFTCYKFRSMVPDAESRKDDLAHLNEVDGPVFKIRNDPRRLIDLRWLRTFSIDEMPQFWNVLKGDMSLVGPRPLLPSEIQSGDPRQLRRISVKPGITGLWQVSGRSDLTFDQWVMLDLEYIRRRSLWFDLELLIKTIPAVISGRGAY